MNAKNILIIAGGAIILVGATVFSTLSIQNMTHHEIPPVAAVVPPPMPLVQPPPPPPPAPATAQILVVKPHYISIKKPHQVCQSVPHVIYEKHRSTVPGAGLVLGGVAGGLAGSLIKGNSHTAAIVAGSALGAVGGHAVQKSMNKPQPHTEYSTVCNTHTTTQKVQKGYEVTYVFNGMQGMVLMDYIPVGNTIPAPYQPVPTTYQQPPPYQYQPAPATQPVGTVTPPTIAGPPASQ